MRRNVFWAWLGVVVVLTGVAVPAAPADVHSLIKDIFPVPSVSGNEEQLAAKIAGFLPKGVSVEKDNLGSLFARVGPGAADLAVLVPLDEFGYVVSGITADGYLRVDRTLPAPVRMFDSFLLGHPVMISTKAGPVNGLVCQPAMHLLTQERRAQLEKELTLDMIFIDLAVRSEAEARAKGIEMLDPVTFLPDLVTLANDRLSGPALGQKAACAAVTSAAVTLSGGRVAQGVAFGWMAQTRLTARGMRMSLGVVRAKNKLAPKAAIIVYIVDADRNEKSPAFGKGPVIIQAKEGPSKLRDAIDAAAREKGIALQYQVAAEPMLTALSSETTDAVMLAIPVKFSGTPSEVVDVKDVQAISDILAKVAGSWRAK